MPPVSVRSAIENIVKALLTVVQNTGRRSSRVLCGFAMHNMFDGRNRFSFGVGRVENGRKFARVCVRGGGDDGTCYSYGRSVVVEEG